MISAHDFVKMLVVKRYSKNTGKAQPRQFE